MKVVTNLTSYLEVSSVVVVLGTIVTWELISCCYICDFIYDDNDDDDDDDDDNNNNNNNNNNNTKTSYARN
jgi:hypothetical protein